jgi:hypothetical protein
MGLEKCAEVAAKVGDGETAQQWTRAAESIRKAMFNDPKFRFIEEGHLIKRRTRDGRWQRYAVPTNRNAMPPGSPAATEERPECEPDTADVYPIIFDMVDPHSDLARNTLQWLEQLWSQRWSFGGYSRYNTFSEPDPPAPWPIATLLMARAYVEAGDSEKVWRALQWLATIHGGKSGGWFERYGPSITPPAPPVCVVGWTWSEVVMLIVHHVIGLRPDLEAITLRPHLIYGVDTIRKHFRVGGTELDIAIYRTTDRPYALVDGARAEVKDGGLRILRSRLRKQSTIEMCV